MQQALYKCDLLGRTDVCIWNKGVKGETGETGESGLNLDKSLSVTDWREGNMENASSHISS